MHPALHEIMIKVLGQLYAGGGRCDDIRASGSPVVVALGMGGQQPVLRNRWLDAALDAAMVSRPGETAQSRMVQEAGYSPAVGHDTPSSEGLGLTGSKRRGRPMQSGPCRECWPGITQYWSKAAHKPL